MSCGSAAFPFCVVFDSKSFAVYFSSRNLVSVLMEGGCEEGCC